MAKSYSQDSRAENGGEWDWMERKLMKSVRLIDDLMAVA